MRALLSAYDKTGIEELASELVSLGCDLISSGGTATRIAAAGIPVVDVADITGFPAILGHRVVTLHPKVHGGILADPTDAEHRTDLDTYGIDTIDLVVANLYPFASDPSIELIDIGGPAMVRAAAKNHAHVGVVVDPDDYAAVLDEIRELGALGDGLRRRLARKAFAHTAAYDAQIVSWFDDADGVVLPETLHVSTRRSEVLRYGENPHQMGARYSTSESWWDTAVRHQGKEMSYLNVFDAEAAWQLVHSLDTRPTAVVVKHANPCGAAVAPDISTAYRRAHEGDPVSAFGGIVALNEPMTLQVAESLVEVFTEVVIAPGFEAGALDVLAAKPNLRVLEATPPHDGGLQLRSIDGGLLVQNADSVSLDQTGLDRAHGPPSLRCRVVRSLVGLEVGWPRSAPTPSSWSRTAPRSASVRVSRTAGTPARWPPRRRRATPRVARAPRTPSSPSATDSMRRPRPVPRRSSSPAVRFVTRRSSPPGTRRGWPWCSPAATLPPLTGDGPLRRPGRVPPGRSGVVSGPVEVNGGHPHGEAPPSTLLR